VRFLGWLGCIQPVACGDWDGSIADDGRRLAVLVGDGQPLASSCSWQFSTAASPHIAAEIARNPLSLAVLRAGFYAVQGDHGVIAKGAGGLLAPLTLARESIADCLHACGFSLVIVTRPDLGSLNHTALTVEVARQRGLPVLGLVLNRPQPVTVSAATTSCAVCSPDFGRYSAWSGAARTARGGARARCLLRFPGQPCKDTCD